MNNKPRMKNITLVIILFSFISYINAQVFVTKKKDTESIYKREATLVAGPCYGTILNENIIADRYAETKRLFTPNLGVLYFIPTGKSIGYVLGLEYNKFSGITAYKGYFRGSTLLKDVNGGEYYPLVEADYTSRLTATTLDIPINLRFRKELANNIEFYLDGGFKLNLILTYNKYLDGIYNKKGLYPNVSSSPNIYALVENEPSLSFTNTTYTNLKTEIESQKVAVSAMLGATVKVITSAKSFVTLNFVYVSGLTDLNEDNQTKYVNVFGEKSTYRKSTVSQMGLRLGVGIKII